VSSATGLASVVVAPGWALLILAIGWVGRPAQPRLPEARAGSTAPRPCGTARGDASVLTRLGGPVAAIGRVAHRLGERVLGRSAAVAVAGDRRADLRRGVVVLLTIVAAAVALPLAPLPALVALVAPRVRERGALQRRQDALVDELVHVVDLLVLAVAAGLTVNLAIETVGRRRSGPVAAGLAETGHRHALGRPLADELDALAGRLGPDVRRLTVLLAGALRYGMAVAEPLERLATELRADQRRRGEVAARRLPVRLLFPLVCCLLPSFVVLTVVPVLLTALTDVRF
jgi:tight adherence protein C